MGVARGQRSKSLGCMFWRCQGLGFQGSDLGGFWGVYKKALPAVYGYIRMDNCGGGKLGLGRRVLKICSILF